MNNKFYLLTATCIATIGVTYLGSCSADFEEPDFVSLEIEEQIMRTKRSSSESEFNPPAYEIPQYENECAMFALTAVKGEGSKAWTGFTEDDYASKYYEDLSTYAVNELKYERGTPMEWDTTLKLGQKFGILNGMESFMTPNGTIDTASAQLYFTSGNVNNIKIINIADHTAKFRSYNQTTQQVKYYDAYGSHECHVSKVMSIMY